MRTFLNLSLFNLPLRGKGNRFAVDEVINCNLILYLPLWGEGDRVSGGGGIMGLLEKVGYCNSRPYRYAESVTAPPRSHTENPMPSNFPRYPYRITKPTV